MNRKSQAADMITLLSTFAAMLIVAAAIVSGVFIFFGTGYNSWENDASALNYKISSCLVEKKFQLPSQLETPNENFYTSCSLSREVIENHFSISISSNEQKLIKLGDTFYCNLELKDESNLPKCTASEVILNNQIIKIETSTKQEETKKLA